MEDRSRYLRTQAAITDDSFLRTIFDTLPGVDANMAAERVHRLPLFRLAFPHPTSAEPGKSVLKLVPRERF
jgi:hypothetical protein